MIGRLVAALCALALVAPAGAAAFTKAIWGPPTKFATYHRLGAGIYEVALSWAGVAHTRPLHPTDPADAAYRWPAALDQAVAQARRAGMRVMVEIEWSPPWANGGHGSNWAPLHPAQFAAFATAAARRYPSVHLWEVWGEPSEAMNFMPEPAQSPGKPLSAAQARAPRLYARLLDAAYGALKAAGPSNLVIGGDTTTVGTISPLAWIQNMVLPGGGRPRMDMYGHDPFSARTPDFAAPALGDGYADFSDLPQLAGWVDRYLSPARRLPLFISEFTVPTDHPNFEFNFYVTRAVQASWLAAALRLSRSWSRIYALGWFSLADQPPAPGGNQVDDGLIDSSGQRKPSFYVYERG